MLYIMARFIIKHVDNRKPQIKMHNLTTVNNVNDSVVENENKKK